MIDERRAKIKELKGKITTLNNDITDRTMILTGITKSLADATGEAVKKKVEEKKNELSVAIEKATAEKAELNKELKLVRMNKNSSKFFEWIPSHTNRRAARQYRNLYSKQLRRRSK